MLVGLWRDFPGEFLVPTYDQDLVWHAHLSVPSVYEKEMRTATYRNAIGHDDSVTHTHTGHTHGVHTHGRHSCGGRITLSARGTTPYARRGTMWRGDAPDWYWTCQFPRPIPPSRAPGPVTEAHLQPENPRRRARPKRLLRSPVQNLRLHLEGKRKVGLDMHLRGASAAAFRTSCRPGRAVRQGKSAVRRDDRTRRGAWLRFQVPIGIFPPEFIADVDDASFITTCSFPVPHCEKYLHATFVHAGGHPPRHRTVSEPGLLRLLLRRWSTEE